MLDRTKILNTPRKPSPELRMNNIRSDILKTPSVQRNIARVREEQIMKNIASTPESSRSFVNEKWVHRFEHTPFQEKSTQQIQSNNQLKYNDTQEQQQQQQHTHTYAETIELKKDRLNLSVGIQLKRVFYSVGLNLSLKYVKLLLLNEHNNWIRYAIRSSLALIFLNVVVLVYYLIQAQKLNFLKSSLEFSNLATTTTALPNHLFATANLKNDTDLHKNKAEYMENNTPYLFKDIQSTPLKSNGLNLRRTSTAESLSSFPSNSNKSNFQNIISTTGSDSRATGYIPSSKYTFKMMDTPRKATYI